VLPFVGLGLKFGYMTEKCGKIGKMLRARRI
jgi:uncharacterized membrane protein